MMEIENYDVTTNRSDKDLDIEEEDHDQQEKYDGGGKFKKYSLLRACSLQDQRQPFVLFPALSCRRRSTERVLGGPMITTASSIEEAINKKRASDDHDEEGAGDLDFEYAQEREVEQRRELQQQTRRATISTGTTTGGVGKNYYAAYDYLRKRKSNFRDWPLGEAKIKNDENYLELELNIGPFKPEEVSSRIVGKELIIHCKQSTSGSSSDDAASAAAAGHQQKDVFRCYALPLVSAPNPADVSIVKDEHWIRIAVRKESALRSPIGLFAPDIAEILEEEQRSDAEDDDEMGLRMED